MKPIWILVADSSTARLFTTENSVSELNEIETITHSEALLNEQELVSDAAGRDSNGSSGGSHTYSSEVSAKEQEESLFAKRLVKHLCDELNQNKFDCLYIVAAPAFLGTLRNSFTSRIEKQVVFSLGKNIVNQTAAEIRTHLPHSLT